MVMTWRSVFSCFCLSILLLKVCMLYIDLLKRTLQFDDCLFFKMQVFTRFLFVYLYCLFLEGGGGRGMFICSLDALFSSICVDSVSSLILLKCCSTKNLFKNLFF